MGRLVRRELVRLFRGELYSREFRLSFLLLLVTACSCFYMCWHHYPFKNDFSVMNDTISNFGKTDKYPNPFGYSYFRLGFSCLCFMLIVCTGHRHRCLRVLADPEAKRTTAIYLAAILCLLLTLFFPDSGNVMFWKIKHRLVHGIVAIAGIGLFVSGIVRDAHLLYRRHNEKVANSALKSGRFPAVLIPFAIYVALFGVGITCWGIWEVRCMFDKTLDHWPGKGIFSVAMWEWVLFTYLLVFMFWFNHLLKRAVVPIGGIASLRSWRQLP